MIHDSFKVYEADSVNAKNGSQSDMPIFGKYAAILREHEIRLICADEQESGDDAPEPSGDWYISTPNGCSIGCDGTESTMREIFEEIKSRGTYDRFSADRDAKRQEAVANAKARHEAKMSSPDYAARYGG